MSIIDKYLEKKKKYIVDYSKKMFEIFPNNELILIKNRIELNQLLNFTIEKYINKYAFNYDDTFILNCDYFEFDIKESKEINRIIPEIEEYCKNILKIEINNLKTDIYYLAFIISKAIQTNELFNASVKSRKYQINIEKLLKENTKYKIKKKKINELIEIIKTNVVNENKFFDYFKLEEIKNKYRNLRLLPNHYFVKYEFDLKTDKFKQEYVDNIYKKEKINDLYLMIAYELLLITILKESNLKIKNLKYIIPISKRLSNNEQDMNKILKIFNRKEIRGKVKFLIDENIALKDPITVNRIKSKGLNICVMINVKDTNIKDVEIINDNSGFYLKNADNFIDDDKLINELRREEN